jgi:glycosyltransferase involved in cell wall biosynthesis
MSILYHLSIPRPQSPALDAVVQEVGALQAHLGGEILYLNPARRPGSRYPERLYGLHRLAYLRRRESSVRLHHVYNPHPFFFLYLRGLRRPIVYSVTAGLKPSLGRSQLKGLERLAAIVVSNERDRAALRRRGLSNVHVIRPGIDTTRFDPSAPPAGPGFTLLAGSAPWTEAQFYSKGIEALLAAAEARSDLRLVFLWRGLFFEAIQARVAQRGLQARVEVINRQVDVNAVLAGVHAAVVLAADATLVKAFPHSLLEALAAGRPVLVSRALPMADYVAQTGCGQVVEAVTPGEVLAAVAQLEASYTACRAAALRVGRRDFSQPALIETYERLYRAVARGSMTKVMDKT